MVFKMSVLDIDKMRVQTSVDNSLISKVLESLSKEFTVSVSAVCGRAVLHACGTSDNVRKISRRLLNYDLLCNAVREVSPPLDGLDIDANYNVTVPCGRNGVFTIHSKNSFDKKYSVDIILESARSSSYGVFVRGSNG